MTRCLLRLLAWLLLCAQALAANELQINLPTVGNTVYFVVWNAAGDAWDGAAFVAYTSTRDTFDIPATEITGTGKYRANRPGGADHWEAFLQAGGTPSQTDDVSVGMDGFADADVQQWAGVATASDDIALRATLGTDQFDAGTFTAALFAADWLTAAMTAADYVAEIAAAQGAVSASLVDPDHTWRFDKPDQVTAPNWITENREFNGECAMDFTAPMPADAAIDAILSTSISPATGGAVVAPTLGAATIHTGQRKAIVPIDATLATAGQFTVTVKIRTTNNYTIVRKGVLDLK